MIFSFRKYLLNNPAIVAPLAPFGVREYTRLHAQRFQSMCLDGERNSVHDNRCGLDLLSAIGGWVKRWMHCGSHDTGVLWCDKAIHFYMLFIRCTEEDFNARRLASFFGGNLSLTDDVPTTLSPDYVAFLRSYDTLHSLVRFYYWLKEILFEQNSLVETWPRLLVF